MPLSEKEKEDIDRYLTDKDKKEIQEIIGEISAVYSFIENNGLNKRWMGDSERFMGFGFFHTKALVKHSIALSKLTWGLFTLTAALLMVSIVQLIILL